MKALLSVELRRILARRVVRIAALAGLLAILIAGGTLFGAEWHAGTITTELTWEPRRARLHLAKVLAAAAFALVGFVALQVLVGLAVTPAAVLRGVTRGVDASWLWSTAGVVARGA